jgi:hypothetical protein
MKTIKNSSRKLFPIRLIQEGQCFEWIGEIYMICDCTNMCIKSDKIYAANVNTGKMRLFNSSENVYPVLSEMTWEHADCILPSEE